METARSGTATAIDATASVALVAVVVFLVVREPNQPMAHAATGAALMLLLSGLFAGAYWLTDRLFVFRMLGFIATRLSWPERKQMALVYAAVFFCIGGYYVFRLLSQTA